MIVVKIGGSLFDHPRLGALGLQAYLDALAPSDVLLVPGGGAAVEAVRVLDRVHALGEEASHWLAIAAMDVMENTLRVLVPEFACSIASPSCRTMNPDQERLPHSWAVTSDSIAARARSHLRGGTARLAQVGRCPAGVAVGQAAARGWVDVYFTRDRGSGICSRGGKLQTGAVVTSP